MAFQFDAFSTGTLRAFLYEVEGESVPVTTFEDHIPDTFHKLPNDHDPIPPDLRALRPAWHKEGYEYRAFLPKDRDALLECHLFGHLQKTRVVTLNGRFSLDEATKQAWTSLDDNLSMSIQAAIRPETLVSLEDSDPPLAREFGYTRTHKSRQALNNCLKVSRHAFLLRLAYFTYILTVTPTQFYGFSIPTWGGGRGSRPIWVDSLWDAVRQQQSKRNYIGALIDADKIISVRWIKSAANRGVPIWVLWRGDFKAYKNLEGGHVVDPWIPTTQLLAAAVAPPPVIAGPPPVIAGPPPIDTNPPPTVADPPLVIAGPPPIIVDPPTTALPPGSKFFSDWQEFFKKRDIADRLAEEAATPSEKQQWENRRQSAKGCHQPGRKGPRVYTWREVAGGHLRELVDRGDVGSVWEDYRRREMCYNARSNTWDLCPMMGGPADECQGHSGPILNQNSK